MAYPEKTQRNDAICRLYLSGLTRDEVAARLGLTRTCVNRILHQRKVTLANADVASRRRRAASKAKNEAPNTLRKLHGWPECPDHLRADYITLRTYMPAAEARATLEGNLS